MLYRQFEKTSQPKVSILIPVFNREEFIGDCIASALNQTFSDIEIIVFDNASTDKTWDICKEFSLTDSRMRIFQQCKNVGPVRNWISCAQEARGMYAKVLFSDDLLEPDCIEKMQFKMNDDIAFVYSSVKIGEGEENSKINYLIGGNNKIIKFEEYMNYIVTGKVPYSPGAALFRTKDLNKNLHVNFKTAISHDYENHGAGPDLMIYLLTFENYKFSYYISSPLVFFRAHPGSFTIGSRNKDIINSYRSVISLFLRKKKSKSYWAKYLAYEWIRLIFRNNYIPIKKFISQNEGANTKLEYILFYIGIIIYMQIILKRLFFSVFGKKSES